MQKETSYGPQLPVAAAGGDDDDDDSSPQAPGVGDGQEEKTNSPKAGVQEMVKENPVLVFGRHGCWMCHVMTRLFLGLGVNPTVYEVVEEDEAALMAELSAVIGGPETKTGKYNNSDSSSQNDMQFPAVFVGGKLLGGLDRVMAAHISVELVPTLREAGALWLWDVRVFISPIITSSLIRKISSS